MISFFQLEEQAKSLELSAREAQAWCDAFWFHSRYSVFPRKWRDLLTAFEQNPILPLLLLECPALGTDLAQVQAHVKEMLRPKLRAVPLVLLGKESL